MIKNINYKFLNLKYAMKNINATIEPTLIISDLDLYMNNYQYHIIVIGDNKSIISNLCTINVKPLTQMKNIKILILLIFDALF